MAAKLIYDPLIQAIDANGDPYSGAKLYVYDEGTTTARTTYSDEALSVANSNPLIADSAGRFGPIFVSESSTGLKLTLKTSNDVLIWTQDNVSLDPLSPAYSVSTVETSAGVTVVNSSYPVRHVLRYGTNTTPGTTDMTAAIQAAIDVAEAEGGGDVYLDNHVMAVSDTLTINGPVWLRGQACAFEQLYVTPTFSGSVLKLADSAFDSASKAIVLFDYTGAGDEQRLHAGATNVMVFGNRGSDPDPSSANARDTNTYGIGFQIKGPRYVTLDHCFAIWCAEDGVQSISDTAPSNNIRITGGGYLSNYDDGLDLAGGDSFVSDVQLGYNGGDGFACTLSVVNAHNLLCWDNFGYGARIATNDVRMTGNFYDNQLAGVLISGTVTRISLDAICQDNGKDTGQTDAIRSGVYVSGAATNVTIRGATSNKGEDSSTGQVYGLRIDNAGAQVNYSGFIALDNSDSGYTAISDVSSGAELTIDSGEITVTKNFHRVDTESDASSDDLATINGGWDGYELVLKPADGARTVVVKHGTGNIACLGSADFTMDEFTDSITLRKFGATWTAVSEGDHGSLAAYTPTNVSTDRSYDANSTDTNELADVLGTLIADLQARKIIG